MVKRLAPLILSVEKQIRMWKPHAESDGTPQTTDGYQETLPKILSDVKQIRKWKPHPQSNITPQTDDDQVTLLA